MSAVETKNSADRAEELVDYVDGSLGETEAKRVESLVADNEEYAAVVVALRELPPRLRDDFNAAAVDWSGQRERILAAVDDIAEADKARTSGFDVRILLPIAAALVIALAGLVSLRSPDGRAAGVKPARAALALAVGDPALNAELSELVGVNPLWSGAWGEEQPLMDLGVPRDEHDSSDPESFEQLDEDELEEARGLFGV